MASNDFSALSTQEIRERIIDLNNALQEGDISEAVGREYYQQIEDLKVELHNRLYTRDARA